MIDRREWVKRHHPVLEKVNPESPLTVGNGNFAFSADISGLQTLYDEYAGETPLCTMANWGWHTIPADTPSGRYTLEDCEMDRYSFCGREVRYAKTRFPGNEHVYDWLRQNPHKFHLARIGFRWNGETLKASAFANIRQELDLWRGRIVSEYELNGTHCRVVTACDPEKDALAFTIETDLLLNGLTIDLEFPYGSGGISGADWHNSEAHSTVLEDDCIQRKVDQTEYRLRCCAPDAQMEQAGEHHIRIRAAASRLELCISFGKTESVPCVSAGKVLENAERWWAAFWRKGGAVDLSASEDPRAFELERRIVLSLYLLAVNSSGCMPPAETGLICNSWFGKAHLEMHFWHMAWAPLWGHSELLMRSLPWYHSQLPLARENAARNGYRGARWPKMVGDVGIDCPSPIAVLLVWQQPHVIVMLELIRRAVHQEKPADEEALMRKHWILVKETADFMADYAVLDVKDGFYHIEPPVIPVQECHEPEDTRDPAFETAYWKFGLGIAIQWARMLGIETPPEWTAVHDRMVPPPQAEGLYLAHANEPETFTRTAVDHPSMLQTLGMLPGADIEAGTMTRTLDRVVSAWDYQSLWGWDFAVMAMTALRLGRNQTALDELLRETDKNTYVASGNNRQISRKDLPLYLPGNGSLLLAAAMMAAGWDGSREAPGFAGLKGWKAAAEGIHSYF